ncbi:TetR/AcrR family transcriptional regulator [Williamsia phyllosphaerae]|uniref:Transcriptional regulator, TetR family protein n=1 Tax=Williamsia phyllosphaerae TaxID=885042 RepID=A0ABQ1UDZ8_9NOCA|nr:TetR/AcrR family transcriptional regulator [Williamsia phyllosphaerae]GGF16555.1 putative transcriptional regulator, TetR family protein [Williamsia phyllosphaerae]
MSTSNDVLDAARTCLLRSDGRKITLAEVAREAGVSRPTVYRRWPEVSSVIRDLLTREMAQIITEHRVHIDNAARAAAEALGANSRSSVDVLDRGAPAGLLPDTTRRAVLDALVDTTVGVAVAVGEDAVFEGLARMQPEVIAPYIFTRLGTSQRGVLTVLTEAIVAAQSFAAIRPGQPDHLAAMILLIAQSAIQSRTMMAPILGDAWPGELRIALTGYLSPTDTDHPRTHGDLT